MFPRTLAVAQTIAVLFGLQQDGTRDSGGRWKSDRVSVQMKCDFWCIGTFGQ
ncbi:hypothetical protein E4U54_001083, partial [Claviceps lovelessii]